MSNQLAVIEPRDLTELYDVAKIFAASGLFNDVKSQAQAVVKIMAGRELGFGAFASMNGIHIISGKTAYSANLMAAAIKRHPSPRYDYRVIEHTETVCKIEFTQDGEAVGVSEFTIQDAAKAQVTNNQTWKKYPKNMLFARALSNGARWYCPDVFGAAPYMPEEIGAQVDEDGDPVDAVVIEPSQLNPPRTPLTQDNPHPAPGDAKPGDAVADESADVDEALGRAWTAKRIKDVLAWANGVWEKAGHQKAFGAHGYNRMAMLLGVTIDSGNRDSLINALNREHPEMTGLEAAELISAYTPEAEQNSSERDDVYDEQAR